MTPPKNKLYTIDSESDFYRLDFWRNYMAENNLATLEIIEGKRMKGTGFVFCKYHQQTGDAGSCGSNCDQYKPNNGKSGRCKHYGYIYEETGTKYTLKNNNHERN